MDDSALATVTETSLDCHFSCLGCAPAQNAGGFNHSENEMTHFQRLAALIAASLTLGACASLSGPPTVAEAQPAGGSLTTFHRLAKEAGLEETLKGAGPYTVFAPSDEAFAAVPAKSMDALTADKDRLASVLRYHVLAGKVSAEEVKNGPAKTVQGESVALSRSGSFVTVEDAVVTTADVPASNGVVHVIDRVLMPPVKK
jgi:uncharacterized surface protein with fasciclin (FAS1) repeats